MEWFITGSIIILGIAFFVVFTVMKDKNSNKIIEDHLRKISKQYNMKFSLGVKEEYDYLIENKEVVIYIKKAKIPSNSSVTINARNTWCLRWGGKRVGRSYPNMRYMKELIPYLICEYQNEKKVIKVVLIYPDTEVILKYLNESELATVKPLDNNYGTRAIRFLDFEEAFKELIK